MAVGFPRVVKKPAAPGKRQPPSLPGTIRHITKGTCPMTTEYQASTKTSGDHSVHSSRNSSDADHASDPGLAARLQDMVLDSADVHAFLTSLVAVAAESFTESSTGISSGSYGDVFCGVTLLRPRMNITVASSSLRAQLMDEVQHGFDDGPCLRAARTGEIIHVTDFHSETRFQEYRDAIAGHGIRSALGIPVRLDNDANAGLDFYSTLPYAFDAKAITVAQGFAREASRSLRLAVKMAQLSDKADNRARAMESRTTIDLALGVIMAQNRCPQDEALKILRRTSSSRNIKLRDLAAQLLEAVGQGEAPVTHFD
jgi:GAF domain-containing protein